MRFTACLLVAFACVLLASIGCSSPDDVINNSNPPPPPPPGAVDGPCSNPPGVNNRFVDCGNGTVTDTTTNLIWLKNADCFGHRNWESATYVASKMASGQCGLTDNSSAGLWRLPTIEEWGGLVMGSCLQTSAPPCIPDQEGTGCFANGMQWASGVQIAIHWSSTPVADQPAGAHCVDLYNGVLSFSNKNNAYQVWPVRGGQ